MVAGVPGFAFGQPPADGEAVGVEAAGGVRVPFGPGEVGQPFVADREVALIPGVPRFSLGQGSAQAVGKPCRNASRLAKPELGESLGDAIERRERPGFANLARVQRFEGVDECGDELPDGGEQFAPPGDCRTVGFVRLISAGGVLQALFCADAEASE